MTWTICISFNLSKSKSIMKWMCITSDNYAILFTYNANTKGYATSYLYTHARFFEAVQFDPLQSYVLLTFKLTCNK